MSNQDSANIRGFNYRAPRFSTNFHFVISIEANQEQTWATCTDISEDGLGAELPEDLPADAQVTLLLVLPGGNVPLELGASVEYRRGHRHGFAFKYTSDAQRQKIQAFLKSLGTPMP